MSYEKEKMSSSLSEDSVHVDPFHIAMMREGSQRCDSAGDFETEYPRNKRDEVRRPMRWQRYATFAHQT